MADEKIILTQEGYDKIVAEHEELVSVRRAEVAGRIKEAISYGDISENAEYDAAKNEQAELEERIHKLEEMERNAQIISEEEMLQGMVNIGLSVKVLDIENNEEETFIMVGSTEADPFEGKISNMSAVGKALLGTRIGETVTIEVPDGIIHYKILDIYK